MAPAAEFHHDHSTKTLLHFFQTATSNLASLLSPLSVRKYPPCATPPSPRPPLKVCFPFFPCDSGLCPLANDSNQRDPPVLPPEPSPLPRLKRSSRDASLRVARPNPMEKDGGPAFIGQVFSMCDLSGTGLMAVSTHFDIPFLSKRTPGWLKKMFATITKSERSGPVFHFFMDLSDAVSYVRRLNIPSGVVGACRLDLAYEHFKEKPQLFQFVPNEKQVKAANKLLKRIPQNGGRKRIDGVPVFSAQNLEIAIATTNGIKWYTPYFFDKNLLDNILEESVDQHFYSLIQSRRTKRWEDVFDDNVGAEVVKENTDSLWEPPEVQEVLEEMDDPGIPLSVVSKAAEMQLLHAVDNVLLGNRWLRKAIGIQPKFPYMVDSFERRSLASSLRASKSSITVTNSQCNSSPVMRENESWEKPKFESPFGSGLGFPWSKQCDEPQNLSNTRVGEDAELEWSPLLPKITMVGISTGEGRQMSKARLRKRVEDVTRQLEETDREREKEKEKESEECRDPLFVADVGDGFPGMGRSGSGRWVPGRDA